MSVFATGPRAVGFYNRLGRAGRHHADDLLVESEYRSVFLDLWPISKGPSFGTGREDISDRLDLWSI